MSIKTFLETESTYDIVWDFCIQPKKCIVLGSGTDLDLIPELKTKVRDLTANGWTMVCFNERGIQRLGPADVVFCNRNRLKKVSKISPNSKIIQIKDHRDEQFHGQIKDNHLIIRRDIPNDPLNLANPSEFKPSVGVYSAVLMKHCDEIVIAGFDGYMGVSRKQHRWHSGIVVDPVDTSSQAYSGKGHDYNAEFDLYTSLLSIRGIPVQCSGKLATYWSGTVNAREWK